DIHRVDRLVDEQGGVVQCRVLEPLRKHLAHLLHQLASFLRDLERVRIGQCEYGDMSRLLAVQSGENGVHLLTQLDAADVANPDQKRSGKGFARVAELLRKRGGGLALDDYIFEFLHVREAPEGVDRKLEDLVALRRRSAYLSGRHLRVLAADRLLDVNRGKPVALELHRIEPYAHAVRSRAENLYLPDTGQTGERILQVDDRVVRQKRLAEPIVVGVETLDQQDIGADLSYIDSLRSHRFGKLWKRGVDRVLDQGQRGVQVGSDRERDRERV